MCDMKEAAGRFLYVSAATVNTHVSRIRGKSEASGRPAGPKAALLADVPGPSHQRRHAEIVQASGSSASCCRPSCGGQQPRDSAAARFSDLHDGEHGLGFTHR